LIFLLLSNVPFAQQNCAHHYRNAAWASIQRGEWQAAIEHYDRFLIGGGILNAHDHLDLARAYRALGDTASCNNMLIQGIEKGLVWSAGNNSLSIIHALPDSSWLDRDQLNYDHHRRIHVDRLDQLLIEQIGAMVRMDQALRRAGAGERSQEEYRAQVHATDSLHLIEVKQIFHRYNGFPPDSIIDRSTNFHLMLLIHHFTRDFPETFDYFAGVVKEAIARYQIPPNEYAVMRDRRQFDIDGKSIYGEVPYGSERSVNNIQNIAQVDSLRFSVGLVSLKEHSMARGFELPEGYVEKTSPCDQH
jgi:tetratricopeptide (TPR) repeat protein